MTTSPSHDQPKASGWGWGGAAAAWLKRDTNKTEKPSLTTVHANETAITTASQPTISKPPAPQHPPSPKAQSPKMTNNSSKTLKKTTKGKKKKTKKLSSGNPKSKKPAKKPTDGEVKKKDDKPTEPPTETTSAPVASRFNNFFRMTINRNNSNQNTTPSEQEDAADIHLREKRESVQRQSAWYEEELMERLSVPGVVLSSDDQRALELFDRLHRKQGNNDDPLPLGEEELDDLVRLTEVRKRVQRDEAELEILLERQEMGEDVDEDRLYQLELLARQRMGETLDDDEQAILYYLELDQQDEQDLAKLIQQKEEGKDVDETRLFELELLVRKRNADDTMTDEDIRDAELLIRRREDARVDQRDYRELLRSKEQGEHVDEDRLHLLSLLDRQRRGDNLTNEEADQLNEYFDLRDEEHLDSIELSMLLEKQEAGERVDEERIYELELQVRQRAGEDLTLEEEKDLAVLRERRETDMRQVEELNELVALKENGEDFNEDRLYELELMIRLRQGEELTASEQEDLAILTEKRIKEQQEAEERVHKHIESELNELQSLLESKENGEEVNEARLYELDLRKRQRQGEDLTDEEKMDLELLEMQGHQKEILKEGSTDFAGERGKYDDDSLSSFKDANLTESERRAARNIKDHLEDQGLPITITWSSPLNKKDKLEMSFVSHGDNSYLLDLMHQQENRDAARHEECLEEALELYQVAVTKRNLPESEQLFFSIVEELKREKMEDWTAEDEKLDSLLRQEIKECKTRKAKLSSSEHDGLDSEPCMGSLVFLEAEEDKYQIVSSDLEVSKDLGPIPEYKGMEDVDLSEEVVIIQDPEAKRCTNEVAGNKLNKEDILKLGSDAETMNVTEEEGKRFAADGETQVLEAEESNRLPAEAQKMAKQILEEEARNLEAMTNEEDRIPSPQTDAKMLAQEEAKAALDAEALGIEARVVTGTETKRLSGKEAHATAETEDIGREARAEDKDTIAAAGSEAKRLAEEDIKPAAEGEAMKVETRARENVIEAPEAQAKKLTWEEVGEATESEAISVEAKANKKAIEVTDKDSKRFAKEEVRVAREAKARRLEAQATKVEVIAAADVEFTRLPEKEVRITAEDEGMMLKTGSNGKAGAAAEAEPMALEARAQDVATGGEAKWFAEEEEEEERIAIEAEAMVLRSGKKEEVIAATGDDAMLFEAGDKKEEEEIIGIAEAVSKSVAKEEFMVGIEKARGENVPSEVECHMAAEKGMKGMLNDGREEANERFDKEALVPKPQVACGIIGKSLNFYEHVDPGESLGSLPSNDAKNSILNCLSTPGQDEIDNNEFNFEDAVSTIALTDSEIDELNMLLDAQEQGMAVDEERLYELELMDRYTLDDNLTSAELEDLGIILKRRNRFQKHTKEYNELLDQHEAGQCIDTNRLYLLELVVRQRLGESLTRVELKELAHFEAIEEQKDFFADDAKYQSIGPSTETLLSKEPFPFLEEAEDENKSMEADHDSPLADPCWSVAKHSSANGEELIDLEVDESRHLQQLKENGDCFEKQRLHVKAEASDLIMLQGRTQIYEKCAKEYNAVTEKKDKGSGIDMHHLCCLEQVPRNQLEESLTEDELDDLKAFEMAEKNGKDFCTADDISFSTIEKSQHCHTNSQNPCLDKFCEESSVQVQERLINMQGSTEDHNTAASCDQHDSKSEEINFDNRERLSGEAEEMQHDASGPGDDDSIEGWRHKKLEGTSFQSSMVGISDKIFYEKNFRMDFRKGATPGKQNDFTMGSFDSVTKSVGLWDGKDEEKKESFIHRIDLSEQNDLQHKHYEDTIESVLDEHSVKHTQDSEGSSPRDNEASRNGVASSTLVQQSNPLQEAEVVLEMSDDTKEDELTSDPPKSTFCPLISKASEPDLCLSQEEKKKLEELIERQESGDDVDEEEIYELQLRGRFFAGEKLQSEELEDIEYIRERRKRQEVYRKEIETARAMIKAGEEIDQKRYYFLGLIEKKRLGHSLNEEELLDIVDFEAGENDMSSKEGSEKSDSEALNHVKSLIQPKLSAADEARNQALALLDTATYPIESTESSVGTDIAENVLQNGNQHAIQDISFVVHQAQEEEQVGGTESLGNSVEETKGESSPLKEAFVQNVDTDQMKKMEKESCGEGVSDITQLSPSCENVLCDTGISSNFKAIKGWGIKGLFGLGSKSSTKDKVKAIKDVNAKKIPTQGVDTMVVTAGTSLVISEETEDLSDGEDRISDQDPPNKGLCCAEDKQCDLKHCPDNSPRGNEAVLGNEPKEFFQETEEKWASVSKVSHTGLNEAVDLVSVETSILDNSNQHGQDRNSEQDPPNKGLSCGEDKHCDLQGFPVISPRANEAVLGDEPKEYFQETEEKCASVSKVSHTSLNETVALVPVETGILDDSNHHEGDDRNSEQDPPSKGLSSGEDKHCDFQRSPDNSPRANEALLGNKTKESFQETKEKCALVSKVSHTSLNEAVALVSVETGILDDSNQHGIVGQEIGAEGEETPISGKDMQLEESGHSSPLMQDCDPEGSKPIQSPSRVDTNSVHVGVGNAVNVTADVILHRSIDVCRESGPFVQTAHSESHLDFDVEGNNFKSSEFSLNDGLQHPDSPLDHNVTGNSFVSSQSTTDDLTGVFPVKEVWDQDSTNDQSKRKDDDSVYTYEERLLELERNGEELNDDELFVLDIFIKRKEGKIICQEELDQLHLLKNQERGRQQDSKELKDLKHRSLQGQPVDEERIYVLELFQKFRDGKIMNEVELFELDAYDRIRSGEELSVEDLDDLMALRDERAAAKVDLKELENLRLKYDGGEAVDEARLFELEIKAKVRQGVELNDEEMYALELFDKINSGEELTDVENDDLTILLRPASSAEVDRLEPTTESSEPPVSDLQNTVFQGNENDPVDDPSIERIPSDACQADNRDENLEFFNDQKEIVTHEDLTAPFNKDKELQGVDKEQDKVTLSFLKELTSIREMRDRGLDYDEDLLYELELLAKGESGEMMDDDELFKVDMFEKRSMGTVLNVMELDELELLKKRTIDRKLDEDELQALRERLCHGEEVDEDLLYELELFEKMRFGDPLTEDELFELDIFQLIRDGVALSEEQIHELEILKGERMEAALDEEDLRIMRETKARGEPVDEDFLYELELFQRKRNGDSLTKDEELELALFQRRRDEEELQEDDAIKLEILRNKRIGKANNPGTTAARKLAGSDIDDDSVYRRTLLDRQMKGQRLDKQEFVWLELLQKAKRGDSLLEEELDELDVMRKQRKEATSDVEVEQTRKLLEKEMEKRTRRDLKEQRRKERAEKKIQRRLEKEEKREQKRKEKEHEKMLRERRAKVKKMRKKRDKHRDKEGGRKKGESVTKDLETSKEELSVRTQANTAVEIVNMPPVPFLATKSEEAKIGLFGGVFGRNKKSKKELELEEARRRQEELIKEQMKALALENELRELEKEKELQKELVRETVDRKSTGSAGSSSWETDSAAEGQESDDESSVTSSSEESESDSESDGSLESTESFGEETDEKFPENVVVSERRPMRVAKRREMNLRLRMSILHRQELRGMTVDATATKKVSDGHPESEPVLLMEHPDDASSASIEPPAQLAGKSLTEVVDRPTKGKSRTITLSAHLRKKNKKRTSRKHKARYGDELSLGTTQLSKIAKATKTEIDVVESDNNFLKQEVDRMLDKSDRPWIAESDMNQVDHFSTIEPPRKEVNKPYVEKFFNISNQHVFDRSVFNFNQSFGSKMSVVNEDNGSRSRESLSESESVASGKLVQEGEIGSIKEPNDPEDVISLVESLSSFVSLSEQKYIFETPDYETIETRLAEKLRTKEAEFDAAWETIVADENVAAQISQRLRERQRTTRSDVKKDDKDVELNGYYNVPRLFLFEGEKTKSKKTKRNKKRKDRKLQKKLDRTLSKEFRKAMREVFESDSEDEYDKTFGEHEDGEVEGTPDRRKAMGRLHTDLSDNSLNESGSAGSDQSDDFDHGGYMARLRDRSMQQEVRKVLYESRRQLMAASNHSHLSSDDDISQNSDISHREKSGDKPKNNEKKQPKKKRAKKNRNGELVGEDIDPADVYAKELEKQKEKKTFTVADLRKEMEELKQVNFGPPPADTAQNVKKLKTPKKPKSSANIASSGGMPIQRPGLGNKLQSFTTAASELGLLSGGKAEVFGTHPETILEDDDEEEAFLTGGRNTSGDFDDDMGGFNDSKASGGFGFRGAGLSNFNFFSGAASSKTPSKSSKKKTAGFRGSFGAGSSNSVIGDLVNVGPPLASPGGFQEPLPVPDMQDEEKGKGRRSSMFSLMGMGSKRLIPKFTIPSKRMSGADGGGGFMMDDDDDDQFEGGMGLLG